VSYHFGFPGLVKSRKLVGKGRDTICKSNSPSAAPADNAPEPAGELVKYVPCPRSFFRRTGRTRL